MLARRARRELPRHREGYDRDLFPLWTDDDGGRLQHAGYEVCSRKQIAPPSSLRARRDLTGRTWLRIPTMVR